MIRSVDWSLVIEYGMSALELTGFIVGSVRWRLSRRGQRAITLWFGCAALLDAASFAAARVAHNSQTIAHVWILMAVIFALEALASYQLTRRRATLIRALMLGYAVTWVTLLLTVEPVTSYSTYLNPLHSLVILVPAIATLRQRAWFGRVDTLVDPGFLIAAGLSGYGVASSLQTLMVQLLIRDMLGYVERYYAMCNLLASLAEVILIRALFLPSADSTGPQP